MPRPLPQPSARYLTFLASFLFYRVKRSFFDDATTCQPRYPRFRVPKTPLPSPPLVDRLCPATQLISVNKDVIFRRCFDLSGTSRQQIRGGGGGRMKWTNARFLPPRERKIFPPSRKRVACVTSNGNNSSVDAPPPRAAGIKFAAVKRDSQKGHGRARRRARQI